MDNAEVWKRAERLVVEAMEDTGIPYESVRGEAAFYGPKIDMQVRNVIGREETASTNQVDLIMAERFDLSYIGQDNQRHRPQIIHRAPLGTHERFVAFLLEHYGGVFPTWLAPVQVRLIPVATAFYDYAHKLCAELRKDFVRAEVDDSGESLSKKIRNGATFKVPNLFVVGQKEEADSAVSWKRHGTREQTTMPFARAQELLLQEIAQRSDWRSA